jgi:hypothetical protein
MPARYGGRRRRAGRFRTSHPHSARDGCDDEDDERSDGGVAWRRQPRQRAPAELQRIDGGVERHAREHAARAAQPTRDAGR